MRSKFSTDSSILRQKEDYINNLFAKHSAVLEKVSTTIAQLDLPPIQISPSEGKLLQLLIKLHKIETIVEVGTNVGYSTLWCAEALSSNGIIHTIEKDSNIAKIAAENFLAYKDKVRLHIGEALSILPELEAGGPYDMIFIDANKSQYLDYLDWAEHNIRAGGLIVADNVLLSGTVFLPESEWPPHIKPKLVKRMQLFNQRLADESKFYTICVPSIDGITISIKLL